MRAADGALDERRAIAFASVRHVPRLLAALVAALALAGLASAATITGTDRADQLQGTPGPDLLDGRAGDDTVSGLAGRDLLIGGDGRDVLDAGRGDDRLSAFGDQARDRLRCGPGRDLVNADLGDRVAPDCELVVRQLSRDTTTAEGAQHATEVEPDTYAWGLTVVAVFQVGRIPAGGAAAIGFATSTDAGRSWRSGLLPGITAAATPPGQHPRASDPAVAYDAAHGVWLASTLAIGADAFRLLVSRSRDGLTWEAPVTAAEGAVGSLDKEWIVCDNWPASPFRGRCYLSYLDGAEQRIVTRASDDGGLTWSAAATSPTAPRGLDVNGAQPVVQPDGALVVVYTAFADPRSGFASEVLAVRSSDGGATFGPPVTVSRLALSPIPAVRAFALASVEVDGSGRIVAAWQGCVPVDQCAANRILVSSSADGRSWSDATAVAPAPAGVDQFLPGLAADPASGGDSGRLTLVYHQLPRDCVASSSCPGIDVLVTASADGGRTWRPPRRLNAQSLPLGWIARTSSGLMLGDYVSASYVGSKAVAVFALAAEPIGDRLRQAIVAASLPG